MKRTTFSRVVFASLCVLGFLPNAQAQHHRECSNASLQGAYGFHTDATVLPASTRRVNLAVLTFDGQGNYTSRFTVNDNGTVSRGLLLGLTYQINDDCTGKTFDGEGNEQGDLVVLDDGSQFYFIRTNPSNLVLLGFGKRQFPDDEKG